MKKDNITNETELGLYKVKRLEDNSEIYVVARNFEDLVNDLKETCIEPLSIYFEKEVFVSNGILKNEFNI